ncbi:DUF1653 domain-containing protein [Candidatus Pacebacteria bacterium]|nr:DUF1653 domain-containing protein [Candidatus Paceibacterota bacterium]
MAVAKAGQRYRHYKGREYTVVSIARHSETLEEMVVYQAEYDTADFGPQPIWVRPREMFEEVVTVDNQSCERFVRL